MVQFNRLLQGSLFVIFKLLLDNEDQNILKSNNNQHFDSYLKTYNKKYSRKEDYHERLKVFNHNVNMIQQINSEKRGYELELNQFADLTWEEFKERYLQKSQRNPWAHKTLKHSSKKRVQDDNRDEIDWLKQGKVTQVKD